MDRDGISRYEMSDFADITDSDLDALRAGQVPSDDARLGEIARFLGDFDEAYPEPSTKPCEQAHLAAIMQAAQLLAEQGEPAATPASKAHGPVEQVSGLPKPRRIRTMLLELLAPLYAKLIAGALASLMAFSGVAAAGALPEPVQKAVSEACREIGIEVPDGTEDDPATALDDEADVDDDGPVDVDDESYVDDDGPLYVDDESDVDDDGIAPIDDDENDDDLPASYDDDEGDDDQPAPDDDEGDDDDPPPYIDDDEGDDDDPPAHEDDDEDDDDDPAANIDDEGDDDDF